MSNTFLESKMVLPISIIPPVAYFKLALQQPKIVINGGEHYVKQTIRNRYHVMGANGILALTIPVTGQKGMKIPTAQVVVDHEKPWQRQHLRTIEAAYRSAPFYDHYIDTISKLIETPHHTLEDFFKMAFPKWLKLLNLNLDWAIVLEYQEIVSASIGLYIMKNPGDYKNVESLPRYVQVFEDRFGFQPNLSVLDLIFNEGPIAGSLLTTG